jgi:hypothetical protein
VSDTFLIPKTIHDFDIGLGRSIMYEMAAMKVHVPIEVVEAASNDAHLTSALTWRRRHRPPLQLLAGLATRASSQPSDEAAYESLWYNLTENTEGVQTFLDESSPSYLPTMMEAGKRLDGKEFRTFLELLQLLPEWKLSR